MSIAVISRGVLADQVKDHLLKAILGGRYPPGSRIIETGVARELGTSQGPVREALRALEAIGVVEIEPFRGARVRRPSVDELLEAYVVRSDLEALAARLGVPAMTETDLLDLLSLAAEMQRAAAVRDGHAVAVADAAFHSRIVRMAGNAVLERVWQNLEPFLRTYLTLLVPGADPQWSADLHQPIIEALRRGEAAAVAAAIEQHFDEARAMIARSWPETVPDGEAPAPAGIDHH
jgi:DNA-binding GntR family transcriptional regulator